MEFKIEKKTALLWQIRMACTAVLLAILFALLARYSRYFFIPAVVFLAAGGAVVFWYLPAYFSRYRIFVGENAVVVTSGVYFVTSHIMPFKRLVFAGGYSTPLARVMKLKGVTLRAARANILIPEMDVKAADRLILGISGEKSDD